VKDGEVLNLDINEYHTSQVCLKCRSRNAALEGWKREKFCADCSGMQIPSRIRIVWCKKKIG
jgi:hypothetical protein